MKQSRTVWTAALLLGLSSRVRLGLKHLRHDCNHQISHRR